MLGLKSMNRNAYRLETYGPYRKGALLFVYNVKVAFCLQWISWTKSGEFLPAMAWNFFFTFKASCPVGKRMNLPAASAMAEATLRIHRPAVAFETCTASPISWWNATVATNLRNTSSWIIGGRAIDLLVPWLTVSAIISHINMMVGRRKRYLSKSSSSVRISNGLRRSRETRGRGSRLLWPSFLRKNPTSAAILNLLSNNLYTFKVCLIAVLKFKTIFQT